MAAFGPNEWLVDELYHQYLQDRNSVDKAWWEFFGDFKPGAVATKAGCGGLACSSSMASTKRCWTWT